jgi:beta-N-acetylhexosaminidase
MRRLVPALLTVGLAAGCSQPPRPTAEPTTPPIVVASPATTPYVVPVELETRQGPDPSTPSGWGPTLGEIEKARVLVEGMTVRQQARQVLMPSFSRRLARSQVFVGSQDVGSARQVRRRVSKLHARGDGPARLPLLVSIDQEGGVVQRVRRGVTRVPSARDVGRTGKPALARRVARNNGEELRALGFTMVLAPVADVDTAGNPVVGSRAYSSSHRRVSRMVTASVRGYLDAGIIPVVKHFPGHGSVKGDSHHRLPVQRRSLQSLMRTDLRPFRAAIDAGAPAVMTGHIAVPAVDGRVPASLSAGLVRGVLRKKLGFRGLVVTDSHAMAPVSGPYGSGRGAVRALRAGNDLVLDSPDARRAHTAVVAAVRSGRLPRARLAQAATRVLAVRMLQQRIGTPRPKMSVLRSRDHRVTAARVRNAR